MGSAATHGDAHWSAPSIICAVIPDFEALDPDVALILNDQQGTSPVRSEVCAIQNRFLARITPQSHESVSRATGHVEGDPFLINSSAHIHRATGSSGIDGVLDGS